MHNINLAISKLDGIKVAPGEVFSFNDTIGPREEKDGYKEAIIGGLAVIVAKVKLVANGNETGGNVGKVDFYIAQGKRSQRRTAVLRECVV